MNKYIGFKMVQAEPMNEGEFRLEKGFTDVSEELLKMETYRKGYKVVYPDGYVSWSPKEVFEKAYLQVGENNTVVEKNVHDFVVKIDFSTWGDKTTVAHATLANGFIISESSSCVDPENYNFDIGCNICKERIYYRVWGMLGFLLQSAKYGIK